jgi:hypothetical protein
MRLKELHRRPCENRCRHDPDPFISFERRLSLGNVQLPSAIHQGFGGLKARRCAI